MARKGTHQVRYTDANGNTHYASGKTLSEATKKAANKQRDINEGKVVLCGDMTLRQWADECIDTCKVGIKPITLKNYKCKMNKWVLSEIGDMKIKDIRQMHCQKVLNNLDGKSKYMIRKVNEIMNFLFDKAIQNKLLYENPAKYLTKPKGTETSNRSITPEERAAVLTTCKNKPEYVYFLFMLYCGLRPQEAARVRKCDVKDGVLHVRGSKSDNADRKIPVQKVFLDQLDIKGFDLYVTNKSGSEMNENNRSDLWKDFKNSLNITLGCNVDEKGKAKPPYHLAADFVPYCLRHTYCTDLQKFGVDLRAAKYLMGHSDIRLTANIYTHQDDETLAEVATKINGVVHDVVQNYEAIETSTANQPSHG